MYVELVGGSPRHTGLVGDHNDLKNARAWSREAKREGFRSMWVFGEQGKRHVEEHKSLKGWGGLLCADRIIWDIDGEETSLQGVKQLLQCLEEHGVERSHIRIWFSGGKGFHVVIPPGYGDMAHPLPDLPQTMKTFCTSIFPETDPAIYTLTSLIRLEWSWHYRGRYKVPITYEEVGSLSYEEIETLSESDDVQTRLNIEGDDYERCTEPVPVIVQRSEEVRKVARKERRYNQTSLPRYFSCGTKMFREGPVKGRRRPTMQRMVRIYRRRNMSADEARALLSEYISHSDLSIEEQRKNVESTLKSAYEGGHGPYSCHDSIMAHYCDSACQFFATKDHTGTQNTADSLARELLIRYKSDTATVFNMNQVWSRLFYDFEPGETVIVTGTTKIGKTSFVHNMLLALENLKVLNVHLEMAKTQEITRLLQVAHKKRINPSKGMNEVKDLLMSARPNSPEWRGILDPISHIEFHNNRDIQTIKKAIDDIVPDVVLIDSFDQIEGVDMKRDNMVERQKAILSDLMAQTTEKGHVLFIVHHLRKGVDGMNLTKDSMTGSAHLFQQPAHVIGLEGEIGNRTVHLKNLGNRRFQELDFYLHGNPETFTFSQEEA